MSLAPAPASPVKAVVGWLLELGWPMEWPGLATADLGWPLLAITAGRAIELAVGVLPPEVFSMGWCLVLEGGGPSVWTWQLG